MDGRWAPDVIEQWIDLFEAADKWLALFFSEPIGTDPASVEVIGGMYARIQVPWARTSAYAMSLDGDAIWRGLAPGANVTHFGVMGGAFTGILWNRVMLTTPFSYPSGGTFKIDANEWTVGIQVPALP